MNSSSRYFCVVCKFQCSVFSETIDHHVIQHPKSELKIKTFVSKANQLITKNFGIVPSQLLSEGYYIHSENDKETIKIGKTDCLLSNISDEFEMRSPLSKKQKLRISTPVRRGNDTKMHVDETKPDGDIEIDLNLSCDFSDLSCSEKNDNDCLFDEFQQLLPKVISQLENVDQHYNLLKFCRLVAEGKFPLTNIGFKLFMDIVNWYSNDNSSQMRYSEDVKRFWRVGLKLFKGKYLRFMSGFKNRGHILDSTCDAGKCDPSDSQINFAVPSRQILDAMESPVNASAPGILTDMIDQISLADPNKQSTYKLCVDGKKINAGVKDQKLGDVNLWGYETSPTLCDRQEELEDNLKVLEQLHSYGELLFQRELLFLNDLPTHTFPEIVSSIQQCISVLSKRLHDLRTMKVGQNVTLEKLKSQVIGDWKVSKLGFAISAIRSKIYEIDSTIMDILRVIDDMCCCCSALSQVDTFLNSFALVDLSQQANFVCLQGIKELQVTDSFPANEILSSIQQKSKAWFCIREKSIITGSTFFRALGLDGLKKQKQHFENYMKKEQEEHSAETQKRLKHGTENELNAVATLVSKVLPTYFPDLLFFEEGCYALSVDGMQPCIISPDGSLRENNIEDEDVCGSPRYQTQRPMARMGVEIKCPYPGKEYTTPCLYTLPVYYVPQVLCEMNVLNVETLLFVSYTEQSTTVLKVTNDRNLMEMLINTARNIYPVDQMKCPKRIHPDIKYVRQNIKEFVNTNVEFLCEVMSTKAKKCNHNIDDPSTYLFGSHTMSPCSRLTEICSNAFQSMVHKSISCLQFAYNLTRRKATEVVVFLLANTDRINNPDIPYAMPIAYGLKGYSMNSNSMRKMIEQVLKECFERGLYIPIVSFDGQWNNIAIRDSQGNPLTLLQLQKDVFTEAKKESKSSILKTMNNGNVLKVNDLSSLAQAVEISFRKNEHGFFIGPIQIGHITAKTNECYSPSKHMEDYIRNNSSLKLKEQTEMRLDNLSEETVCCVLDTLPENVVDALDELQCSKELQIKTHDRMTRNTQDFNLDILYKAEDQDDVEHRKDQEEENQDPTESPEDQREYQNVINLPTNVVEETVETTNSDSDTLLVTLSGTDFVAMLEDLKQNYNDRWKNCDIEEFLKMFTSQELLKGSLRKKEIQTCLKAVAQKLKGCGVMFALSWPKYKIVELFYRIVGKQVWIEKTKRQTKSKLHHTVKSLSKLCQNVISNLPKSVLNAVYAEHIFPKRLEEWNGSNLFKNNCDVMELCSINWYCKPDYIADRFQTVFHLLDPHHLFTNARIKCCTTGIKQKGIQQEAWLTVAKSGRTSLGVAHVEDLVDRQSDSFAHATFSIEVEDEMLKSGFNNEAKFCRLIREWYDAEDRPGISALDRCRYRVNLREWLLDNVNFNRFPPPGSHVNGIPLIMFEGLLTNIDRRIQLFPYIKGNAYNVRALGSLEAENLFGEFQDLDPKGVGVLRPDDIPCAISTACELLSVRMNAQKSFFMQTSKAKVYPAHQLLNQHNVENKSHFLNPISIDYIEPIDHLFDSHDRSTRHKRKRSTITKYGAPCRGIKPIRQHHRCDEEKILPHKRLGIDLLD